jgi:hypothetical protein
VFVFFKIFLKEEDGVKFGSPMNCIGMKKSLDGTCKLYIHWLRLYSECLKPFIVVTDKIGRC